MLTRLARQILQRSLAGSLLVVLAACAATPADAPPAAPDLGEVIEAPATVVLLPVRSISSEMRDGIDTIQLAAQNTLSEMGYDVFVVKARTYKQMREEALSVSGAIYAPEVGQFVPLNDEIYLQAMLAQIQSRANVDALVKVDLELRDVANEGEVVSWDDQRAKLEVINTRKLVYAEPRELKGLSFRISALDAQGRKRFVSRTGFALPYRLHVGEELAEFQVRDDLFSDVNELKQVLHQALHPQSPVTPPPGSVASR